MYQTLISMPRILVTMSSSLLSSVEKPCNVDRHGKYYDALFEWENLDRDALIQAVLQHREILQAALRRDRPAVVRALVNHIRNNHTVLLAARPQPDAAD